MPIYAGSFGNYRPCRSEQFVYMTLLVLRERGGGGVRGGEGRSISPRNRNSGILAHSHPTIPKIITKS